MQWCDEEFFKLGAYQAHVESGKILLAKGGHLKTTTKLEKSSDPQFFIKDFFTDEYLLYVPQETKLFDLKKLLKEIKATPVKFEPTETDDKIYESDFAKLLHSFNQDLKKVVLVSRENYRTQDFLAAKKALFLKSLQFGTGTPYGFWNSDYGVWGSTPETLFSLQGESLKTFALAGTSKKGFEKDLLDSKKDRVEHNFVIDDLLEKLSSFATKIDVDGTKIVSFKDIIHLRTDVTATLKEDADLFKLTSLLSPTAALGGYPKDLALKFLMATSYQKKYPHRYFGSAFGLFSEDFSQVLVMIRNVQWQNDKFFIESGGGVVADSNFAQELAEIQLKRSVIKNFYL
jgi:isochorismate synthase EntC